MKICSLPFFFFFVSDLGEVTTSQNSRVSNNPFKTKHIVNSSFGLSATLSLTSASHSGVTSGKLLNVSVSFPLSMKQG